MLQPRSLVDAIGQTPLIELPKISEQLEMRVLIKYEAANPGASIKDRAARSMIIAAQERGDITPGSSVLIEPTSGNTGIGIALLGASLGYRVMLTMPESMSRERRALALAYGAELVLTPAQLGMQGAVDKAHELVESIEHGWMVDQFTNPDNPLAHEKTTAPEIEEGLGCAPDYLIAGVGTGGTISGCAHYFNREKAVTKCYAVEPEESPLISQVLIGDPLRPAPHGIQGIGANFIPDTLDLSALSGVISVSTAEALEYAQKVSREEGLLLGISSGANLAAVAQFAQRHTEARNKTVVTFGVDTGERYLSTALFEGVV